MPVIENGKVVRKNVIANGETVCCTHCGSGNVTLAGNSHRTLAKIPEKVWPQQLKDMATPPNKVNVKRFYCKDCKTIFVPQNEKTVIVLDK